jgi:hypothetical protein
MRVIYTPEDNADARRSWEFNAARVRQSEAAVIERQYGKPYQQFVAEAQSGSIRALRVLVWHLMRTAEGHALLRFDDVPDFYVGEVEVRHSLGELREGLRNIESANLDPSEKEMALSVMRAQIAAAELDEGAEGGELDSGK